MSNILNLADGAWPLVTEEVAAQHGAASQQFQRGYGAREITFFFIAGAAVVIFALPWAIKASAEAETGCHSW